MLLAAHWLVAAVGAAASLLVACSGCGTDGTAGTPAGDAGPSDAGDAGDAVADHRPPSDAPVDKADAPCVPPPKPAHVPDGWEAFTDYSCYYPFYIPTSPGVMPDPIRWQPCAAEIASTDLDCREMSIDWPSNGGPVSIENKVVEYQGRTYLMTERNSASASAPPYAMVIIGDVDGPVVNAVMQPTGMAIRTLMIPSDLTAGHYVIQVNGDGDTNAYQATTEGALVGKLGELRPRLLTRHEIGWPSGYNTGTKFVARQLSPSLDIYFYPLDGGEPFLAASSSMLGGGVTPRAPIFLTDIAIMGATSLSQNGLYVFDENGKVEPLLTFPLGDEHGAYAVATDGKDLVWTDGQDLGDASVELYAKRSIMTALFTTDPNELKPRRLRSDPNGAGITPRVVGCGYTARTAGGADGNDGMLVTRLSDGWSWLLVPPDKTLAFWAQPVGMTCDDLYARFCLVQDTELGRQCVFTVARVRLDSMGEGMAAD